MKILNSVLFFFLFATPTTLAFSTSSSTSATSSIQSLLTINQDRIKSLKNAASALLPSDEKAARVIAPNDVFYLRYLLEESYENDEERIKALESNLQWRMNEGKEIVSNAYHAIQSAMSSSEGEFKKWNNEPVQSSAPHASVINQYITPTQCITTTLPSTQDLVYCIRAGKIDDSGLMSTVTMDELVDYFLYCKEVNAMVADMRSINVDRLIKVIVCNDLSGVKLIGGSSEFRSSLSLASKKANVLYPSLNGRSLLLNLPKLVGALVKLFTPLFPEEVRKRIRFESGPLSNVKDLREVVEGGTGRKEFVEQVDTLAYGD